MNHESRSKLAFAKNQVVSLLKSIKSLRRIGIYGSVAQAQARADSDIDLIIVCRDGFLHLCRFQVNWRLWRAGLRRKVSAGVVVSESALKPQTFQVDKNDQYAAAWLKSIQWIYKGNFQFSIFNFQNFYLQFLNWLAKQFFAARFLFDQQRAYPNPHIKFSDKVFFHFGNSRLLTKRQK